MRKKKEKKKWKQKKGKKKKKQSKKNQKKEKPLRTVVIDAQSTATTLARTYNTAELRSACGARGLKSYARKGGKQVLAQRLLDANQVR